MIAENRLRNISRAAVGLAALTLGAKVLGLLEKQIIAYYFGAGALVDAYFAALTIPMVFFVMIREFVEPSFLPHFVVNLKNRDEPRGWRVFTGIAAGILTLSVVLVVVCCLFADRIVSATAPGLDPDTKKTTASLLRIMVPAGVFLGLSTLTYITLNGYRRFAVPALGDIALKAGPLLLCVAFASQFGIFALAVGCVVGSAGRLATHGIALRRKISSMAWPDREAKKELGQVLLLMTPLLLGVSISQVSVLADNFFASQVGAGSIAASHFARKIIDLPLLVLPYTLSVVLFPYFSHLAAGKRMEELYDLLGRISYGLAIVFATIGIATLLMAESVTSLLFERGAFDEQNRRLTSLSLRFYSIGLVTFALEHILVPFYYSIKNTKVPVAVGIVGVGINIVLTAWLIGPLGVGGVALALTISKTFKLIVLAVILSSRYKKIAWTQVTRFGLFLLLACAVSALGFRFFSSVWTPPHGSSSSIQKLLFLLVGFTLTSTLVLTTIAVADSRARDLIRAGIRYTLRWLPPRRQ